MFPPAASGGVVCAFGELVQDIVVVVNESPISSARDDGDHAFCDLSFHRGGVAANVAVAAATSGVPARFLGHFGSDPISASLAEQVQRSGVQLLGVRRGRGAFTICFTMPSGISSIVLDPGDARVIRPEEVKHWWLKDCAVLHLNANNLYNEGSRDAFWKLAGMAAANGIPVSFDVAAANRLRYFGVEEFRQVVRKLQPAVLMMNEPEGRLLGNEYLEGASVVLHHFGSEPTQVIMDTGDTWEVPVPFLDPGLVVDTLGAGDVFAGGFLAGWVQGRSLRASVELAHEVAVRAIQGAGAQSFEEQPSTPPTVFV